MHSRQHVTCGDVRVATQTGPPVAEPLDSGSPRSRRWISSPPRPPGGRGHDGDPAMKFNHHASIHFCTSCGRWHCHCDGCDWIWYSALTFVEALRHTRIHQFDRTYLELQH
jgi:hypothetical protein